MSRKIEIDRYAVIRLYCALARAKGTLSALANDPSLNFGWLAKEVADAEAALERGFAAFPDDDAGLHEKAGNEG